jgi:hypothetical protein
LARVRIRNRSATDSRAWPPVVPLDDPIRPPQVGCADRCVRAGHLTPTSVVAHGRNLHTEVLGHVCRGPPLCLGVRCSHGPHCGACPAPALVVLVVAIGGLRFCRPRRAADEARPIRLLLTPRCQGEDESRTAHRLLTKATGVPGNAVHSPARTAARAAQGDLRRCRSAARITAGSFLLISGFGVRVPDGAPSLQVTTEMGIRRSSAFAIVPHFTPIFEIGQQPPSHTSRRPRSPQSSPKSWLRLGSWHRSGGPPSRRGPGSMHRSGRRGRRFKSCHPDWRRPGESPAHRAPLLAFLVCADILRHSPEGFGENLGR